MRFPEVLYGKLRKTNTGLIVTNDQCKALKNMIIQDFNLNCTLFEKYYKIYIEGTSSDALCDQKVTLLSFYIIRMSICCRELSFG